VMKCDGVAQRLRGESERMNEGGGGGVGEGGKLPQRQEKGVKDGGVYGLTCVHALHERAVGVELLRCAGCGVEIARAL